MESENEEETGLMEDTRMLDIDIERVGDAYLTKFIVDGAPTPLSELSLSDIENLRLCLYKMIDKIDGVNTLNRCPLCQGMVRIKPNVPGMPILIVRGKVVCEDCSLSITIPKGLDDTEAKNWWNGGRKKIKQLKR